MKRCHFLLYTSAVSFLLACQSVGTKVDDGRFPKNMKLSSLSLTGPIVMHVRSTKGRSETVNYFHRSIARTYNGSEIQKSLQDQLDFTSKAETVEVDADGNIKQIVSILSKDGTANLHHFAMPDLGEKLEVTTSPLGKILKSGKYPQNSIFFVPTLSVPDRPISVGDTWTMKSNWVSLDDGIPFTLDMVSILKQIHQCPKGQCLEIEMSGEVTIAGPAAAQMDPSVKFKSEWRGRLLFETSMGTVLWSKVYSDEHFASGEMRREVRSCLESLLQQPKDEKIEGLDRATCEDFNLERR